MVSGFLNSYRVQRYNSGVPRQAISSKIYRLIAISVAVIGAVISFRQPPFGFPRFVQSINAKPAFIWNALSLLEGPLGHTAVAVCCLWLLVRSKVKEWYEIAVSAYLLGFVCGEYLHLILMGRS